MNAYAALVTLHVLLLVFWLGTDMGVFFGSFRLRDPRLSVDARLAIARLTSLLDMGPRTGVILSVPTGRRFKAANSAPRGVAAARRRARGESSPRAPGATSRAPRRLS